MLQAVWQPDQALGTEQDRSDAVHATQRVPSCSCSPTRPGCDATRRAGRDRQGGPTRKVLDGGRSRMPTCCALAARPGVARLPRAKQIWISMSGRPIGRPSRAVHVASHDAHPAEAYALPRRQACTRSANRRAELPEIFLSAGVTFLLSLHKVNEGVQMSATPTLSRRGEL